MYIVQLSPSKPHANKLQRFYAGLLTAICPENDKYPEYWQ